MVYDMIHGMVYDVIYDMINNIIFECSCSPMCDNEGDIVGVIGIALDVTDRVSAQNELDNYRHQVEKNARLAEIGTMGPAMAQ